MASAEERTKNGKVYAHGERIPIDICNNEPAHGPNIPYKQLDSAKAYFTYFENGTTESYIEHAPMHGVTPRMLIWFFKHLDCYTKYNPFTKRFDGPEISVYRLWHLRDHIGVTSVKPGKHEADKDCAIAYGSTFEIQECLLQKHDIKASSKVYDLYYDFKDGTRLGDGTHDNGTNGHEVEKGNFGFWLLGPADVRIGFLDHYFQVIDHEKSIMALQTRFFVGRDKDLKVVNKGLGAAMPPQLMKDWILHNIEESGETENVVPVLYQNQDKLFRKSELTGRTVG